MNKEWIKFSETEPKDGQIIWAASVVDTPICMTYCSIEENQPYTHWMNCHRPQKPFPDKAPEEMAMEEFIQGNPEVQTFPTRVWYAAIAWERERKK